jgi:ribonuclease-3
LPRYEVTEVAGESPALLCRVLCHVDGLDQPVRAEARNRRIAEQDAAREALARLGAIHHGRKTG